MPGASQGKALKQKGRVTALILLEEEVRRFRVDGQTFFHRSQGDHFGENFSRRSYSQRWAVTCYSRLLQIPACPRTERSGEAYEV